MCKKINNEAYTKNRRLSKSLLKEIMNDPLIELDFFHDLNSIKKPTFQSFMNEQEKKLRLQKTSVSMHSGCFFNGIKRKKNLRIANFLVVFFLCIALLAVLFKPQPSTAGKTELNLPEQEVTNGFIEDSHVGVEEPQSMEEIIEDEKYIEAMKEKYEDLVVPTYIPEEYVFDKLSVKKFDDEVLKFIYVYQDNRNDELNITQRKLNDNQGSVFANEVKGFEELEEGKIFYQEDESNNRNLLVIMNEEEDIIWISGNVAKEKLLKIKNNLII
ncbi:MAG: DUF4367 domain-containing protein [Anaerovorax sp.]|nr:DUF4367 domain-containing protein [Anaerovorax sp.]